MAVKSQTRYAYAVRHQVNVDSTGDFTLQGAYPLDGLSSVEYVYKYLAPATDHSGWCIGDNFGFNIPGGATILGVRGQVRGRASATGVNYGDPRISYLLMSGSVNSTARLLGAAVTLTTSFNTLATYGGEGNLWGVSLTPALVNASTFGLGADIERTGTQLYGVYADINLIEATVWYEPPRNAIFLGSHF